VYNGINVCGIVSSGGVCVVVDRYFIILYAGLRGRRRRSCGDEMHVVLVKKEEVVRETSSWCEYITGGTVGEEVSGMGDKRRRDIPFNMIEDEEENKGKKVKVNEYIQATK